MALIKCVNCEREYTDVLDACPHCGFRPTLFKCPECGRFCGRDDQTCRYCGLMLTPDNVVPVSLSEIEKLYDASVMQLQAGGEDTDYKALEKRFLLFGDFRDSKERASECRAHYAEDEPAEVIQEVPAEITRTAPATPEESPAQRANRFRRLRRARRTPRAAAAAR